MIKWCETIDKLVETGDLDYELSFDRALEIKEEVFKKYSKTLEEDIIVCRREVDRFMGKDGKTVYADNGFTSTSIYEYAKKDIYGDELNYILIPKGTKVMYVEPLTCEPGDFEVLFEPGIELTLVENLRDNKKVWTFS